MGRGGRRKAFTAGPAAAAWAQPGSGKNCWPRVFRFAAHYPVLCQRTAPPTYTAAAAQPALSEAGSAERAAGPSSLCPIPQLRFAWRRADGKYRPLPAPNAGISKLPPKASCQARIPKLDPYGSSLDKSVFSLPPCTAHSLFDASKREWGVHPRAAKRHTSPVPAPAARLPRRGKNTPARSAGHPHAPGRQMIFTY